MTSTSAKDLAVRLRARVSSRHLGRYLTYGPAEAAVDEGAAALLTRYAEVEGEMETTEEERAKLRALAEKDLRTPMPEPADALAESLEPRWFCLLLDDLTRLIAQVAALKEERDAARAGIVDLQVLAYGWMVAHDCLKAGSQYTLPKPADVPALVDAANARAERLADARLVLDSVIPWLEAGCDLPPAVTELRILKRRIDAALLTGPEAKGGDPDTHVDDDGRTADRTDPNGAEPTNIAQPARDTAPVPATTEKTDD